MGAREWKPGDDVPKRFSGMPVAFSFNEVALTTMLRVLREHYQPGHTAMVAAVKEAMRDYTPHKPDEPTGLGAVIEAGGIEYVRCPIGADDPAPWTSTNCGVCFTYAELDVTAVLSEGVQP